MKKKLLLFLAATCVCSAVYLAYGQIRPPQWLPRIAGITETPAPYCFDRFSGQAMFGEHWMAGAIVEVRSGDTVLGRTVADVEGRFSIYLPALPPPSAGAKFYFVGFRQDAGAAVELPLLFELSPVPVPAAVKPSQGKT